MILETDRSPVSARRPLRFARRPLRFALLALLPALLLGGCSGKMPSLFSKKNGAPAATAQAPASTPAPAAVPSVASPPSAPVSPPRATFYSFCNLCLIDAEGRRVANAEGMRGYLEGASRQGETAVFTGWAADTLTGQPAAEILFVSKGAVLLRTRSEIARPDVATALQLTGPNNRYGFEFTVDIAGIGDPIVVWAIDSQGRASALPAVPR